MPLSAGSARGGKMVIGDVRTYPTKIQDGLGMMIAMVGEAGTQMVAPAGEVEGTAGRRTIGKAPAALHHPHPRETAGVLRKGMMAAKVVVPKEVERSLAKDDQLVPRFRRWLTRRPLQSQQQPAESLAAPNEAMAKVAGSVAR
jgi:hypothetical protein